MEQNINLRNWTLHLQLTDHWQRCQSRLWRKETSSPNGTRRAGYSSVEDSSLTLPPPPSCCLPLTLYIWNGPEKSWHNNNTTRKYWEITLEHCCRPHLLDKIPQITANGNQSRQLGLYQTRRFLHGKGSSEQSQETSDRREESISQLCIWSQFYKEFKNTDRKWHQISPLIN